MNILYINTCFWGGGAEKVSRQLYYGLKDKNIKTYFIAGRYQEDVPDFVEIIYENFFERAFSALLGIVNHNFLFRTVLARRKIIKFIEKEKIDIVHFHNVHGNYIGPSDIRAIKRHCKNVVITMHDMWLITGCCPHGMSCDKWKDSNRCQGCKGNEWLKKGTIRAEIYLKVKAKNFSKEKICFVSPSNWLIDCCKYSYLDSENICLIPNGINIKDFNALDKKMMRKKHDFSMNKRIILFSAHHINSPYKGIQYLVDALLKLPEKEKYCLLIVGNGEVSELKLQFVTYEVGFVNNEQLMNELYSAADLYVVPSMADTFPLAVLESMASGTPVLAFKTGGIPEAVNDDVGWNVAAGDSVALMNMIIHIFENKEEYYRKMQRCRQHVVENFSEDLMIEKYKELYKIMSDRNVDLVH